MSTIIFPLTLYSILLILSAMWREEEIEEILDHEEVEAELKEEQGNQNLRDYASTVGCTASYLSQVYNSVRPPSEPLLEKLGLERRVIYVRKKRRWR